MPKPNTKDTRFQVALSFPGERRKYVEQVAEYLAAELGRDQVFYDNWYKAELTRPNLDLYLQNLYHQQSALLVPFLCENYEKKDWCQLEWKVIRDLMKQRRDQDIMPMRFDKTHIPGLFDLDGYLDLRQHTPKQTADLILQRLALNGATSPRDPSNDDENNFLERYKTWLAGLGIASLLVIGAYLMQPWRDSQNSPTNSIELPNQLTLLPIKAGPFEMGGSEANEQPLHTVIFTRDFWMSRTEITFTQYDAYAKAKQLTTPDDQGWGRMNRPVIHVNAQEAAAYTTWLSRNNDEGLQCRLPSEAEWEYAARAGTRTRYSWGDSAARTQASCRECDNPWSHQKQTAPVASFAANGFGLQDMHGNVAEWVQDVWHDDYQGAPPDGRAWLHGDSANEQVIRGGSWSDTMDKLTSTSRQSAPVSERFSTVGFRVVCRKTE